MRYILNSAVITAPGLYYYRLLTPEQACEWYGSGAGVLSTIGYPETAKTLSLFLDKPIEVNRITIEMRPWDEALVFRLVLPSGSPRIDPKDKGQIIFSPHTQVGYWELGLLRRLE